MRQLVMTTAMMALSACTAGAQDERMVLIEGGTFQMGSPATEPERYADETLHEGTVADLMMSRTEAALLKSRSIRNVLKIISNMPTRWIV